MTLIRCPVCRAEATGTLALCSQCETPHHPECWEFVGGCAVFACGETRARAIEASQLELGPGAAEPLQIGDDLLEPEPLHIEHAQQVERERARRESPAVMMVSWVYLAASLVAAIPTLGYVVAGLTGDGPFWLVKTAAAAATAVGLKMVGDLLALGERRGRVAHLYLCFAVALVTTSLPVTACLAGLAAPFWTRRGREHFVQPA